MKLVLLLCLSFVPWSRGQRHQKPQPLTQPLLQDPAQPNCDLMERLRAQHERERINIPRGDKFDNFDWRLSKELNAVDKGNVVISPVSLKVVLAMLYEGARGVTAQEIGDALGIQNNTMEQRRLSRERFSTILKSLQTSEGEYKIKMGTHAFISQTAEVYPNYQCKLRTYYSSDIVKVDFSSPSAAIKVINNWARNVTEGLIQDLISDLDDQASTVMLLLNAVYFKGEWEVQFPVNQTKPGVFRLDDNNNVTVPFMNTTQELGYRDLRQLGAHMVELKYKGGKFSMYVLLPYNTTGLDVIAKKLGPDMSLSGIIGNMVPTDVNLIMPKFEFHFTTKLKSTLEKMGMATMFSPGADLTDVAPTQGGRLVVSNVLQKAGISVTEAGTVAFAATVVEIVNKFGESEETVDFVVDRPFLFFIEDTTLKTTVFVGKVTNPDLARVSTPQQPPPQQPPPQQPPALQPSGGSEAVASDRLGQNGQSGSRGPPDQPGPKGQTTQLRFNFFDGDLLRAVGKEMHGNYVVSPASVKTLLGLIMEAADGQTLEEVRALLRLPSDTAEARRLMGSLQAVLQNMDNGLVDVVSATTAFLSRELEFNTSYAKAIADVYQAGVKTVDFKSPDNAASSINSWVNTRTRGRIPSLIDPASVDPDTMAILVNAVYFDGKWKNEFLLKDTSQECFYSEPNLACNNVYIMNKKEQLNYKFDKDFNSHIVQMPYQDERFSMVLVVPAAKDGARKIARDINRLTFPSLVKGLKSTEVLLQLPRFSVEYESDLTLTLTKMGLDSVFTDAAKLPFMVNKRQGRVSAVIHKAKIDVTEKGTKAAAASGATVVPLMSGNEALLVSANRPFYYYIYEAESHSVLFTGRVSSLSGAAGDREAAPVGDGATALAASSPERPSYAPVVHGESSSSSGPQNSLSGQPSPSQAINEQYHISSIKKSRPQSSDSDVRYPDGNEESHRLDVIRKTYEDIKKRNQPNPKLPFTTNNKDN